MTHEEKRFQAAVAIMQSSINNDNWLHATIKTAKQLSRESEEQLAINAVIFADALLAELDRTATVKESLTVQPDADGWISHKPGDPCPCPKSHFVCVRFRDGDICGPVQPFALRWSDLGTDGNIIAWKPA